MRAQWAELHLHESALAGPSELARAAPWPVRGISGCSDHRSPGFSKVWRGAPWAGRSAVTVTVTVAFIPGC